MKIEAGYLLEEVVIIEGGLTIDNMIIPFNNRTESIDEMGIRKTARQKLNCLKNIQRL